MRQPKPSRYRRHLSFLKIGGEDVIAEDYQQEKDEITSIKLPPLVLKEKPSVRPVPWLSGLLVLAAALYFFVWPTVTEQKPQLTFKGDHKISAVVDRGGQVTTFKQSEGEPGDRINFRILAAESVAAYLTISDRDGKGLLTRQQVLASKVLIAKGSEGMFPKAIRLDSDNSGEKAAVVLCPINSKVVTSDPEMLDFSPCQKREFILRE